MKMGTISWGRWRGSRLMSWDGNGKEGGLGYLTLFEAQFPKSSSDKSVPENPPRHLKILVFVHISSIRIQPKKITSTNSSLPLNPHPTSHPAH
jgi:hypothetical protein